MSKNKDQMPDICFIGPARHRTAHKRVLFLVEERDSDGIPTKLIMLKESETIEIKGGERFMTGYVPEVMTKPAPPTST